ncbi:MAG: hypothetical protein AAFY91_17915, partial [Bacteroidota bacterium]
MSRFSSISLLALIIFAQAVYILATHTKHIDDLKLVNDKVEYASNSLFQANVLMEAHQNLLVRYVMETEFHYGEAKAKY